MAVESLQKPPLLPRLRQGEVPEGRRGSVCNATARQFRISLKELILSRKISWICSRDCSIKKSDALFIAAADHIVMDLYFMLIPLCDAVNRICPQ